MIVASSLKTTDHRLDRLGQQANQPVMVIAAVVDRELDTRKNLPPLLEAAKTVGTCRNQNENKSKSTNARQAKSCVSWGFLRVSSLPRANCLMGRPARRHARGAP